MFTFASRVAKTLSDMTVGTVIVLVHVALADREHARALQAKRESRDRLPS